MRTTSHRDKFDQHYGSTIVIALLVIFAFSMTKFILYDMSVIKSSFLIYKQTYIWYNYSRDMVTVKRSSEDWR